MRIATMMIALLAACGGGKPADTTTTTTSSTGGSGGTLFTSLGGEPAIKAVVKDFVEEQVAKDNRISMFFTNTDIPPFEQKLYDQLCAASGGGCTYTGKDMKTVHKDMEISNDTWNQFTGHLNETVTRFHIPDRERNELVVIVQSLKKDIVNR
jgi:hemoglobin